MRTLEEMQNDRGVCACGCEEKFKYSDEAIIVEAGVHGNSQGYPELWTRGRNIYKKEHIQLVIGDNANGRKTEEAATDAAQAEGTPNPGTVE